MPCRHNVHCDSDYIATLSVDGLAAGFKPVIVAIISFAVGVRYLFIIITCSWTNTIVNNSDKY